MTTEQDAVQATMFPSAGEGEAPYPSSPPAGERETLQPPIESPSAGIPEPLPAAQVALLQRQLQQRDEQLQQYQARQRDSDIRVSAEAYKQQLLSSYNYSDDQADVMSKQYEQFKTREVDMRATYETALDNEKARLQVSMHIGNKYGINPQNLYHHETPQAMEQEALHLKRIADLENQVNGMKKAQVPSQDFNSPEGTGNASNDDLVRAVAQGRITITDPIAERLKSILYQE